MKQFKYSLETVLDYKTKVLDNLKSEHAVILGRVNRKKLEIEELKTVLNGFQNDFDEAKNTMLAIEYYRLYDMCIEQMERKIETEREKLQALKKQEKVKKNEVVAAKVDTSKFEKLRAQQLDKYNKAEMKAEEAFAEEFVTQALIASDQCLRQTLSECKAENSC